MRSTLILLAAAAVGMSSAMDKPVYSSKPAPAAQTGGSTGTGTGTGGPSKNERWDDDGDGKSRTLYYGDTALIGNGNSSSGKRYS